MSLTAFPATSADPAVASEAKAVVPKLTSAAKSILELARGLDRDSAASAVRRLTDQALTTSGRGLDLTEANLSGLDLSGFDLRHAILNRAALYGTKLVGTDLTGASMVCAGLERTDFTDAVLRGAYVHALAAQASNFTRADLTGLTDATGSLFHGCNLTAARLDDAELAGATFYQCNLIKARVTGTDLHGAVFNESRLDGAEFSRARLDDVTITRCGIRGLNLRLARGYGLVIQRPSAADGLQFGNAHLPHLRLTHVRAVGIAAAGLQSPGIDIADSHLAGADFRDADLSCGRWARVSINDARLGGTSLTDSFLRDVTAAGADLTEATGEGLTATECSFAGSDFTGFAGRYATFRNCDFRAADLRRTYLYRSSFMGDPPASACMVDVKLDGANLTQAYLAADFTGASLQQVWATYARVNQSIFDGANLRGTSLFRSSAVKTSFVGAAMSGQRGAIFADRCAGLVSALRASNDPDSHRVAKLVEELTELLHGDSGKST
jgi:uncharacterized protein YjbI with pentapeptide repeats